MASDIGGVWRTVGGRRIFIKNGQDLSSAMKESGKFQKSNKKIDKNKKDDKINPKEEVFTDSKGRKTAFKKTEPKEFQKSLDKAKESQPPEKRWRVDNASHSIEDYKKDSLFVTKNGSTVAITKDGDIISVCNNANGGDSGRALIEYAVNKGGKKLDSYDGNFDFYTKMGFEPVSWVKFNEEYAPSDWVKGRDKAEPIVFFKYKGNVIPITKEEFYKKVKPHDDYDEAMKFRDKEMK